MLSHEEVVRLYGPWRRRTPPDAIDLLTGYRGRWWIAGGWAIEAFTGAPRPHGDLDLSIPVAEVSLLQEHLNGRLDVWCAWDGSLRPLVKRGEVLPDGCGNLWLRAGGAAPWEYDVILMDTTESMWTYKRDARISKPLEDIVWERGGVTYLRPEVQLLHKAPDLREKDCIDFETSVTCLDEEASAWLCGALQIAHPGHPWLRLL